MNYEKEYIDYLIKESDKVEKIKPILDGYFLNSISFDGVVILVEKYDITTFHKFKKSINIDSFLK